jgi:hypothetical protein
MNVDVLAAGLPVAVTLPAVLATFCAIGSLRLRLWAMADVNFLWTKVEQSVRALNDEWLEPRRQPAAAAAGAPRASGKAPADFIEQSGVL